MIFAPELVSAIPVVHSFKEFAFNLPCLIVLYVRVTVARVSEGGHEGVAGMHAGRLGNLMRLGGGVQAGGCAVWML